MSADTLLSALNALYHNTDPAVRAEADRWLEQFTASTEAWAISDAVLHDDKQSLEAHFFSAQTLRTKVHATCLPPSPVTTLPCRI